MKTPQHCWPCSLLASRTSTTHPLLSTEISKRSSSQGRAWLRCVQADRFSHCVPCRPWKGCWPSRTSGVDKSTRYPIKPSYSPSPGTHTEHACFLSNQGGTDKTAGADSLLCSQFGSFVLCSTTAEKWVRESTSAFTVKLVLRFHQSWCFSTAIVRIWTLRHLQTLFVVNGMQRLRLGGVRAMTYSSTLCREWNAEVAPGRRACHDIFKHSLS